MNKKRRNIRILLTAFGILVFGLSGCSLFSENNASPDSSSPNIDENAADYTVYAYLLDENGQDVAVSEMEEAVKTQIYVHKNVEENDAADLYVYSVGETGSKTLIEEKQNVAFENGLYQTDVSLALEESVKEIVIELKHDTTALVEPFVFREQIFAFDGSAKSFEIDRGSSGKDHSAIRQFPFLFAFGDNVFACYSQHTDTYESHPVDAVSISRDGGKTWTEKVENEDFYLTSMVQLADGTLLGINYMDYYIDQHNSKVIYWTSSDMGKTWEKHIGNFYSEQKLRMKTSADDWASVTFHREMHVMADGSIQGTMYGYFDGDTEYRSIWVKSEDNGQNWSVVSTIAKEYNEKFNTKDTLVEGFCEPVSAICADGSILVVMRVGSYEPLYYARSYDGGKTWTTPKILEGIYDEEKIYSVDPELTLLSNGTLVLTYGRPSAKMLVSLDGCGYTWTNHYDFLLPTTSGYTGIREVEPGKLLVIGDTGTSHGAPDKFSIWGRFLTLDYAPGGSAMPTSLQLMSDTDVLNVGKTAQISIKILDQYGLSMPKVGGTVQYFSKNTDVATVNEQGVVTCLKEGTVEISAIYTLHGRIITGETKTLYCGDETAVARVNAYIEQDSIFVGDETYVYFDLENLLGDELPFEGLTYQYSSSKPEIATVDEHSYVTGVKEGEAQIFIHVTQNGVTKTGSVKVTVLSTALTYVNTFEGEDGADPEGCESNLATIAVEQKYEGDSSLYINDTDSTSMAFIRKNFKARSLVVIEFKMKLVDLTDR